MSGSRQNWADSTQSFPGSLSGIKRAVLSFPGNFRNIDPFPRITLASDFIGANLVPYFGSDRVIMDSTSKHLPLFSLNDWKMSGE
jgi:hypothetical protein